MQIWSHKNAAIPILVDECIMIFQHEQCAMQLATYRDQLIMPAYGYLKASNIIGSVC